MRTILNIAKDKPRCTRHLGMGIPTSSVVFCDTRFDFTLLQNIQNRIQLCFFVAAICHESFFFLQLMLFLNLYVLECRCMQSGHCRRCQVVRYFEYSCRQGATQQCWPSDCRSHGVAQHLPFFDASTTFSNKIILQFTFQLQISIVSDCAARRSRFFCLYHLTLKSNILLLHINNMSSWSKCRSMLTRQVNTI